MGVRTIRIVDEMFLLNPKYYKPLCEKLADLNKNDEIRLWSYSRVDTIKKKENLELIKPGLVPGPTIAGKGNLVHEYAVHVGAKILFSSYQTAWIGFN